MIYPAPPLSSADEQVMTKIKRLREDLRFLLVSPRRWYGTLRRAVFARAVQGSNSIEGYHASVEDVAAVIEEEEPLNTREETRQAISCYTDAMTYVLQVAKSKRTIDSSLLLALHYMIMKYDLGKNPGQWRPGANQVVDQDGRVIYTAPDRELVEELVEETLDDISKSESPVMISAAMAHLNLALVHPWSDGNGRMARCLQTLVLATERTPDPVFSSIEEYLGRNTPRYYAVLAEVNHGRWSPWRDTRPWIEFCLTAHYRQGRTLQRRIEQFEALWNQCEHLAALHRLPDRVVDALTDAARGRTLWRSLYVKITRSSAGEKISDTQGTRDLLSMHRAGLLEAVGAKRGRRYRATPELRAVWGDIRTQRPSMQVEDPYEDIAKRRLPGI